ncbi:hypothetical protein HanRHA438_Chr11g0510971 [Helianthus annuus]|uniref:Ankyrin repeat-containing domain-containing protein n=2 Tax=Helianthus annuus TaxID=4232 RepID=A0A9K3HQ45_HELAN|nr:hypothetical protein HanXRQr2_Chr11g0498331 [Helianthus annuus]KAJ0510074.1 hypothetical protein HanIR_Chr11g0536541 [Helianthus annuus]KAJ0518029.1 hypothetical protein HanHA89_Chr11g0432611 [Helianthus annuus]KAJ0689897.1 hypothetical protein HanOQP8_Chr11g0411521 [Helianthus annuus]KAJ0871317.1 hypothetical protein HanRHA438_Chr11g0510971 [Helianthus annuus]
MDNTDRKILYEAAVEGWWWKAKYILKIHKSAATVAINENADTILHVAVEMGQNYFVEKLVEFLNDEKILKHKILRVEQPYTLRQWLVICTQPNSWFRRGTRSWW